MATLLGATCLNSLEQIALSARAVGLSGRISLDLTWTEFGGLLYDFGDKNLHQRNQKGRGKRVANIVVEYMILIMNVLKSLKESLIADIMIKINLEVVIYGRRNEKK